MHGRHIDLICEHLEAVTRGEIRDLLITVPPRHAKSLLVSVFWPVWVWITHPERRWIYASYAYDLSLRDSLKCRRLVESAWFRRRWGHVELMADQRAKGRYETTAGGARIATSIGGLGTGEGADVLACDDAHNVKEAESETVREGVIRWWDETMSTRFNDPTTGARVIVMQRVHAKDLAGHVLEQGGYAHLCLPAEYEPEQAHRATVLYPKGYDWRTTDGELLWPERFPRHELERLKRSMGSYAAAGQLQQRPTARGGGLIQREWVKVAERLPSNVIAWVRYWDKAASAGKGDYTCGLLLAKTATRDYIVVSVVRGQWSPGTRSAIMQQTAASDGKHVAQWIEQEGGSGGKESAEISVKDLAGYTVHVERVTGSKEARGTPVAAQAEGGNLYVLRAEWNYEFLQEICAFPFGKHDDQFDGLSGAFNKLAMLNPGPYAWLANDPEWRAAHMRSAAPDAAALVPAS